MRIDSHVHPGSDPADLANPAEYRSQCEAAGIGGVVLIGCRPNMGADTVNTWIINGVKAFGDFIIPVPLVEIDAVTPDDIHRLIDRGARGIKFIRPDLPYRHEKYLPLYEAVKARDSVAVFHTGYLMHTPDYHPRLRSCMDDMRPAHIDGILRWVPHLKVLMAHFGNPWWEEAWKVMVSHPTVYADLSGGTAIHRSMFMWREIFAPNGKLSESSMQRLCFGTDLCYFRQEGGLSPQLPAYIDFHERLFEQTSASPSLREQVNSGNVRRLFGM